MDFSKVTNTEWEDIDHKDYPDYVDAYCVYGEINGIPLSSKELDELNESEYWYDLLINFLN